MATVSASDTRRVAAAALSLPDATATIDPYFLDLISNVSSLQSARRTYVILSARLAFSSYNGTGEITLGSKLNSSRELALAT